MYLVLSVYCTLTRLQNSVNMTFIWTGKPKNSFESLYSDICFILNGLQLTLQYLRGMPALKKEESTGEWVQNYSISSWSERNSISIQTVIGRQCGELKIMSLCLAPQRLRPKSWFQRVHRTVLMATDNTCCKALFNKKRRNRKNFRRFRGSLIPVLSFEEFEVPHWYSHQGGLDSW